jgi:hypothetical protein
LAPDALLNQPELDQFSARVHSLTAPIKAVLLDQTKVVSGVGNWVADEVLYQARIHPSAVSSTLSVGQLSALHEALDVVIHTAVAADADADRFPSNWLFHHRWSKSKKKAASKDARGDPIEFVTVGGRTSAVVRSRQLMGLGGAGFDSKPPSEPSYPAGFSAASESNRKPGLKVRLSSATPTTRKRRGTPKSEGKSPSKSTAKQISEVIEKKSAKKRRVRN